MGLVGGLGEGLQDFAKMRFQAGELDRRAQDDALRLALQQQQFEAQLQHQKEVQDRLLAQDEFNQNFKLVSNLPEGTPLDPAVVQGLQKSGLGSFAQEKTTLPSRDYTGAAPQVDAQFSAGIPDQLQAPLSNPPALLSQPAPGGSTPDLVRGALKAGKGTGEYVSVPTEDSKARAAQARDMASLQRVQMIYSEKAKIAAAHDAMLQEINRAKLTDPNRARALEIQAGQLKARFQQLDLMGQQMDNNEAWRYGVQMPDINFDNSINAYKAENPATGAGNAPGATAASLLPGAAGTPAATPAPAAKPRPAAPKAPALGPKPGTTKKNSHGDTIQWDGSAWTIVQAAPAPKAAKK